jgi:hypothetical protein
LGFIQVPKPPDSPDITPTAFWLVGYLKNEFAGKTFHTDSEVILAVSVILKDIPLETFCDVMDGWEARLKHLVECRGE